MAKNKRYDFKKGVKIFGLIIFIIFIFAFFDYIIHSLSEEYAVPSYYFTNKVIYGTLWGIIAYFIFAGWKTKLWLRTLVFSGLVALVLQARYAYEGYPLSFVIEFLFIHFGILWFVSYITFKFGKI
jgi:hypothetical protein